MKDLCDLAIDAASAAGATYADVRCVSGKTQEIQVRDRRVNRVAEGESLGVGIRAIADGAWGFAASDTLTKGEVVRVAKLAVEIARASALTKIEGVRLVAAPRVVDHWQTPYQKNPFRVPDERKISILLAVSEAALKISGVRRVTSSMNFEFDHKFFANTDGSFIEQEVMRSQAGYTVAARNAEGFETRSYQPPALSVGFEEIERCGLVENAARIAGEAVEKTKAPKGPGGTKRDLILLPSHLMLTIHESVGHSTELDRAMGWEADFAGTTFCTPDRLGKLQYGSPAMNIVADRTLTNGRASCGYDDEGVRTKRWYLIRKGVLVGLQTTRDTAWRIGEAESNGCAYADSWSSIPILRIPNVSLEADPAGPTLEQMISGTRDGILIDGRGSYSIDQQRFNFQFGGDAFWEIKDGKRGRMLRDVTYHSNSPVFWNSLVSVGRPEEWRPYGITSCGKGQPGQRGQQTHGCPPCVFRDIAIGGAHA